MLFLDSKQRGRIEKKKRVIPTYQCIIFPPLETRKCICISIIISNCKAVPDVFESSLEKIKKKITVIMSSEIHLTENPLNLCGFYLFIL